MPGLRASTLLALAAAVAPQIADARLPTRTRGFAERIEPVFDLPDRAPYRLRRSNLDLGYLYPVRGDGRATIGQYRQGRYVLYAGDGYIPLEDGTLALIEQNIGEDPLAVHHVARQRRLAGLTEALPAAQQAAPARFGMPRFASGGGQTRERVGRGFAADAPAPPADGETAAQAAPVEAVDNRMLATATVVIALILAGIRLARATSGGGRGKVPRGGGAARGADGVASSRLRRWVADES